MKKSLIALAVLGAFSGAAFADGSNVQLYGLIDLGLSHVSGLSGGATGVGSPTENATGLSSGVAAGSRIGVKGTEDLGNGLTALFTVETGFCAAGLNQAQAVGSATASTGPSGGYCSGGGFMQRQSFAGLTGDFGTVIGGRMNTPLYNEETAADPFGYGMAGTIGNLSITGGETKGLLQRVNQTVAYVTPNFSGFTGTAAYSFAPLKTGGNVPTTTLLDSNVPRALVLDGKYAGGPLTVGADYTEVTNEVVNTVGVNDGSEKVILGYGIYDFGVAKVSGLYERLTADYTTGNDHVWMVGATIPAGPGNVLVSYSANDNSLGGLTSANAKQYALGYTYALSKRTNLYTSYSHLTNDMNTAFVAGDSTDNLANGLVGVKDAASSGFDFGIRMQF
jgi:predicted porin